MTVAEQLGRVDGLTDFVRALQVGEPDVFRAPAETPDLLGYLELPSRSGFPEPAIHLPGRARREWLVSQLEHSIGRDVL